MNSTILQTQQTLPQEYRQKQQETILLYPGIELIYLNLTEDRVLLKQEPLPYVLQIHYCRFGHMEWKLANGTCIHLGPGDFSVQTMKTCADSAMLFPMGAYKGLILRVDLEKAACNPPDFLRNTDIFKKILPEKFCRDNPVASLTGNTQSEAIFSYFYDQSATTRFPYQKLKALELLLYLSEVTISAVNHNTEYSSGQAKLIREIHDYLLEHMDQRITISDLSKKYLINPTSLKSIFKSVYGMSIASHIKEHRMAYAAKMLHESDLSIAEIARNVGYDSQSRFSDAFKSCYHTLPTEYRKKPEASGCQTSSCNDK